jgi:4-hydroxy-tetrahydrodipicolinate synthase
VAVRYAAEAQDLGAAAVMFLPPFFGGWIADLDGVLRHCEALSKHTTVPLILQDHPLSGVSMPASFLVDLARRVERLVYFKVEAPRAPAKIGRMRALDAVTIQGLFGGTGGVLFLEELAQGADGTMPSSLLPAAFVRVFDLYRQGDRDGADAVFRRYLPLVNFETHLGGYRAAKELLALRRTIRSAFVRGPIRSTWDDATMHAFRRMVMDLGLAPRETPA